MNSQPWLMYLLAASDEQGPASIPNKVYEASCNISFCTVLLCTLRNCKGLKDKCSFVGSRSLPDCSVYGCERENLLASPQALESGFLQTAPVHEVLLTCSLTHWIVVNFRSLKYVYVNTQVWKNSKPRPNESQWWLLPNMPGCLPGAYDAVLADIILTIKEEVFRWGICIC